MTLLERPQRQSSARANAWRAFLAAHASVTRRLERDLEEHTDLSLSAFDVLITLDPCGDDGMRLAEVAERVMLTRSGLTRVIDRLVEQGYVERRACATDRRGLLAVLTPAGRRTLRRALPTHIRGVRRYFTDVLSPSELDTIAELCSRVADSARED